MQNHIICTRRLEWDAMHRVPDHEGLCKAFHGHRYVAEISCTAPELDALGRIIDFGVIKDLVGSWINRHFDHTAILHEADTDPAIKAVSESNARYGKPVYILQDPPTAENIARELGRITQQLLKDHPITVVSIRIWETPNCSATWFNPAAPSPNYMS